MRAHRRASSHSDMSDSEVPELESDAEPGYLNPELPGGARRSGGAPAENDVEARFLSLLQFAGVARGSVRCEVLFVCL